MQKKKSPADIEQTTRFPTMPRQNCPHIKLDWIYQLQQKLSQDPPSVTNAKCKQCGDDQYLWICLPCGDTYCSQRVQGHMAKHHTQTKDPLVMSLFNTYFWCYACEGYVTSMQLNLLKNKYISKKFPEGQDDEEMEKLAGEFSECVRIGEDEAPRKFAPKPKKVVEKKEEIPQFKREDLIQGLRSKKFKNIVFLTGAGISVSSGIPDFRTPGTGLYSQLQKYNLPEPQAVFSLQYFKTNPQPFYMLTKQLYNPTITPVISHKFIKKLNDQGLLLKCITQNVDGLELSVGLPLDKLIQAHGHNRSSHCIDCKKQIPISDFNKAILDQKVLKCQCGGLVKPDVVFFGEKLPKEFQEGFEMVRNSDLVVVMGTSLVVYPFAFLVEKIEERVPIVLINNTDSRKEKNRGNSLWLDGDLDGRVKEIVQELKWEL